jgi:hypothetical protein
MHPKITRFILSLLIAFGSTAPALAVDDLGLFELDGNALASADPGDDWEDLYANGANNGGSPNVFTGVDADPAPQSIFDGGKKDIQTIEENWSHKSGAVPDKDDITNAYAAAYEDNGDLIVYFGADRITNVGDAFLGFWFFKNQITANEDGSFSGDHANGDALILVNFPQGANAVPDIQVVEWDNTCKKAKDNTPNAGECVAVNLRLRFGGTGANAVCGPGDDLACAITNEEDTVNDMSESPWPYTAKDGTEDAFPFETFYEGGANLTELLGGGDLCFASFMAETRSSSSFTASLKDFRLDSFPVCAISVTKACTNPRLNAAGTHIIYDISGTVTNDGFGTVFDVNVTDSPAFDAGSLTFDADPSSLAGGADIEYDATITVPLADNGTTDTVTATANTLDGGGGTELSDTAQATCPVLQVNPAATVTKNCRAIIDVDGGTVSAKVGVRGTVCNTGDSVLTNVSVTDNKAGVLLSNVTLVKPADPANPGDTAGACRNYSGTYVPDEANDVNDVPLTDPIDPSAVWFHDTVTVSATDIFGEALDPQPTASAQCPLCPQCENCEETP